MASIRTQELSKDLGKMTAKTLLFFFVGVPALIFLFAGLIVLL